ncbi:NAD(P)-dependent oxidoreductase [Rhodococcus sp. IEGM 1366]|uniref:NAD(P)-dependent oxidoreductase n=1 Tax=Rhodococcus sp. IEGM 1366 TaxID=3082223 RepID=UPI0029537F40|nr:NAD(P)-dependent oxidoreductase [Rhodococcus sp. IEGM 1366]MDV8070913.1 NAD(P)-dependent oxidoreductase [Rhodococcus sp. IEGM 1366]
MSSNRTLGFIGLGVMGGPMCANLASRSEHDVIVFDLDTEALQRVAASGAKSGASVIDVAERADVVFLSLPSIVQVESVVAEIMSAPNRPSVIVDMSTSDVTRTRLLGESLARDGVELVDAPVARLRQAAKDGTLLITVGATADRFFDLKPLLSCMGSDVVHAGALGAGQVIKILNNMVVFQTVNALAEARAIGTAAGVDPKLLFETLTLGSADSFVLRKSAMATLAVDEFPVKTFPTLYAIKDLNLALQLARDKDVPTDSADATMTLLEATRDAGYADEYYPVMVKLIDGGTRK